MRTGNRTAAAVTLAAAASGLMLTGCGITASTASAPSPTTHPAPAATLSPADAGRICTGLNALLGTGLSNQDALATVRSADAGLLTGHNGPLPLAGMATAIRERCPGLYDILPK